jgi:ribonuclease R
MPRESHMEKTMDGQEMKTRVLELMAGAAYMPMRKRGLAKALHVSDADYRAFRALLEEMAAAKEISEPKHGKFSLPLPEGAPFYQKFLPAKKRGAAGADRFERPGAAKTCDDESGGEDDAAGEAPPAERAPDKSVPPGARVGRIEVKRGGMGFLLSDPPGNDLYIAAEDLGGALDGDLVAVEVKRRQQQGRRSKFGYGGSGGSKLVARVVKIMERAHTHVVGTFYIDRRGAARGGPIGHVVPDTRGMFSELDVLEGDSGGAKDQDKVALELVEADQRRRPGANPTARITKVFGPAGEADADILAIIENFNVKTSFPDDVLRAAEEVDEELPEAELAQRTFHEHPVTFTIDPEDARDHDDAVALRRDENGLYTLLVHIADVSYYVKEGSVIDREAVERATSVYLPGRVFPMLPPKLSNNMCSLKEGQLRLTKTVSITYGRNLTMQEIKIERSYIRSAAFLTYNKVKAALDDGQTELARTPEILDALKMMREFALALREKRLATGSLELELPEAKLLLDDKMEVTGWIEAEHHWAHELIEDMMLAANRAVAQYLVEHEVPALFRIHEEPDPEALKRFGEFVREFGISLRPPIDRLKLKSVLDRVKGKEFAHTIHLALLTSLKQAKYSAECQPHFALNFPRYLHFTSPIRRYPDLIAHRALDSLFTPGQAALPIHGKKMGGSPAYHQQMAKLRTLAAHCSRKERDAAAAESEVVKFRQMEFLRRNARESHIGIITRVRDFGMFIELQDCFVEGLIRLQEMTDDWYEYHENQHMLQGRRNLRSFRLGDKVDVRIKHIDLGRKQVDLELV